MAPQAPTLLSPSELSYLHSSLSLHPPIRPDARSPTSFRPLVAETDLLPSANGSARLCFAGGTEAIVGVKAEVERTGGVSRSVEVRNGGRDGDEEDEDMGGVDLGQEGKGQGEDRWVEVTIDMPGQRDDDAMVVFLGQMIREGLIADGGLRGRLVINGRWHWRLFVDILLLSQPQTYPLPLLSLTTHLALLSTRLPAPISTQDEDPLFNDDWETSIPLYPSLKTSSKGKASAASSSFSRPPITLLVTAISTNIFFDPSAAELAVADAVLAITVSTPSASSDHNARLELLAVRTIDPPSRMMASGGAAGGSDYGPVGEENAEGVWRARKGGMSRGAVGRMVQMCVEKGGVGEEVLRGLEGFI